MKTLDLQKLTELIMTFSQERDWDQFHSVKNLSMALSVEASELAEIFQWIKEDESNNVKNQPATLQKVEEEVADVFIYLLRILSKTDINLEDAVMRKMKKNELKYPIEKVRGSSKKYDEY